LKKAERGKLIMACGTGKTFTALKLAEKIVPEGGNVLFLVPSISLISQTLTEWAGQSENPLNCFAVCSDPKAGAKRIEEEDISTQDLAFPAHTNARLLVKQITGIKRVKKQNVTVIFSTYQSIGVISEAQKIGLEEFDLVICDEAHRTTGVEQMELSQKEASAFVAVHDAKFLKARKRLYMTATPRIYDDASKGKAKEADIAVFPSLHFQVHHHNYMDLELLRATHHQSEPTSIEHKPKRPGLNHFASLIDVIFNPRLGDSTVLLGHRGAFKTELCLDFAGRGHWGCPLKASNPRSALLISLIDNTPNTHRLQKCPWAGSGPSAECSKCSKLLSHVRTFCQRPGCITSAEFLYYINRCIRPTDSRNVDQACIQRVVFWDLTQMDYRFQNS
jgi:hypothetical protein